MIVTCTFFCTWSYVHTCTWNIFMLSKEIWIFWQNLMYFNIILIVIDISTAFKVIISFVFTCNTYNLKIYSSTFYNDKVHEPHAKGIGYT